MGLSRSADRFLDPVVELLRPISGIAWIPLGLFIFGVGDVLPVFIMVYVAFFPLLLNTISGVRNVDQRLVNAARTMGVHGWPLMRQVIVPAALPTIMVGFRLAFAGAWAAVIAAELIGAPSGLGFAIEWYRQLLMTPKVFAFIVVIGVVGYLCDLALRALQRRLTPWAEGMGLSWKSQTRNCWRSTRSCRRRPSRNTAVAFSSAAATWRSSKGRGHRSAW